VTTDIRDQVQRLCERIRERAAEPANRAREALWVRPFTGYIHLTGAPNSDKPPFVADLQPPFFGKLFGFDLRDYYTNPDVFLLNWLKGRLWHYENVPDDVPLQKRVPIRLGVAFESSLFGASPEYQSDTDPWISRDAIIRDQDDLARLSFPDFYRSGLMREAHLFYNRCRDLLPDDFEIMFSEWRRGPLGLSMHLNGMAEFLTNLVIEPEFAHALMRFVTDARKHWAWERARFLGLDRPHLAHLHNDEVMVPLISGEMYREWVWPYEQEIYDLYGGVAYWHSCGDITPMLPQIRQISFIGILHISAVTNLEVAAAMFPDVPLDVCVRPLEDILAASPEQMRRAVAEKVAICRRHGVRAYNIRAGALHPVGDLQENIRQIQTWVRICREIEEEVARGGDLEVKSESGAAS